MRPTRHQMFMEIARAVSKRATCMRLNVGAVIVQNRRILSVGYNGHEAGAPHCAGNECPGRHSCMETIHAEDNALRRIPEGIQVHGFSTELDLYVTHSPCAGCVEKIEKTKMFRRIFFETPYRKTDHLKSTIVDLYRVHPAGYVVTWPAEVLVDIEV